MHTARMSHSRWTRLYLKLRAKQSRKKMFRSEGVVDGIAQRTNAHGPSTSLLRFYGGMESAGLFSVDSFASSGGQSGNQCAALSFF